MATSFDDAQAARLRYGYEKLPYTALIASLSAGVTNIFSATDVGTATEGEAMAILSHVGVTQLSSVGLTVATSESRPQGQTSAYPPSLAPTQTEDHEGIRSTGELSMSLNNSSGATPANVQVNYAVATKTLSTADKILRGLSLTTEDEGYAQKFGLRQQGIYPVDFGTYLRRGWFGRILTVDTYADVVNATAGASIVYRNLTPKAGELLVITGLASSAPVGNQALISITRDSDLNYLQVLADNMSLSTPLPVFLPAKRTISCSVQATVTTNSLAVRMTVARVRMSTVLQAILGDLVPARLAPSDLAIYEQVQAGVIV